MTFKEIQNAVIADRFDESQRADVKNWINDCYDTVVSQEEWAFKTATALVTVTNGSRAVTGLPSDLGVVLEIVRADGVGLQYMTPSEYENTYLATTTIGKPDVFTVEGASVKVGPVSNETSTGYQLLYQRDQTMLSADTDVPILPASTHMVLVFGAAAIGLTLAQDYYGSSTLDGRFQERLQMMRRRYLVAARDKQHQSPPYRPYG